MRDFSQGTFQDCVVWAGPDVAPVRCASFAWKAGTITAMDLGETAAEAGGCRYGVFPGLVNAHTHVGDCFLPEVAVPLTLEEAFFRPHGYKYRALESISAADHVAHMTGFLREMAASGTVAHVDFREQGVEGARRLREASGISGVRSIILSQLNASPQSEAELSHAEMPLPKTAVDELREMLSVADGFSESTMNDLTDAAWRDVRSITRDLDRARAIHCLENDGYRELSLSRTGTGDLQRALDLLDPDLVVHLTVATDDEIELLAASGKTAVLNPRANAALGLPLPPVAKLMRAGVNLLLGTDNGILNGPDLFRELDFTYRLARSQWGDGRHPLPGEILKMATANFGRTHWGAEIPGTLTEGGPATFVVVDLTRPHFQNSRDLTGTLITRTSPGDLIQTVFRGKTVHHV
ncbi:MAG: amidohydrolase family protein [Verrucomicrobia bacterium]|nr:amidohydrolase family protein [Verrucomicrobiota bacterium]MCH8514273.1 amidohydrolase family protein [Kiritimatiellia bacterium]